MNFQPIINSVRAWLITKETFLQSEKIRSQGIQEQPKQDKKVFKSNEEEDTTKGVTSSDNN